MLNLKCHSSHIYSLNLTLLGRGRKKRRKVGLLRRLKFLKELLRERVQVTGGALI